MQSAREALVGFPNVIRKFLCVLLQRRLPVWVQQFFETVANGIVLAPAPRLPGGEPLGQRANQGKLIARAEVIADDGEEVVCELLAVLVRVSSLVPQRIPIAIGLNRDPHSPVRRGIGAAGCFRRSRST